MRHHDRIQPYITPEVHRKLSAYAVTKEVTESAVVEAALRFYLDRDRVQEPLVLRRLDDLAHSLAKIEGELQVLAWGFARFVRLSYLATPPVPTPEVIADELKGYARWVELSSAVTTADALSKTVQFGLRDVFRRDRMWQEHRRGGGRKEPADGTEQAPANDARRETVNTNAAPPRPTPAPSPSPSLPPPSAAISPRANKNVEI